MAIRKLSSSIKTSRFGNPPSLIGGNVSDSSIYNLLSTQTGFTNSVSPTAGGTLTINNNYLGMYDYTVKIGNQTISSFTSSDWFTTTEDSRSAFIVVRGDLTINSGITFIPPVRKLFTCIYVTGNFVNNGTVSMTARGANHSGLDNSGGFLEPKDIRLATGTFSGITNPQIPALGGLPGTRSSRGNGVAGNNGVDGGSGGGGSGSHGDGTAPTDGSRGTCFSGGSGGGGAYGGGSFPDYVSNAFVGVSYGGRGGYGGDSNNTVTSGGGAGNPGGKAWNRENYEFGAAAGSATDGSDGTGGTIIVFVEGSLSGNGLFVSNGSSGGIGGPWSPDNQSNWLNGGGGSGAGSINILTRSSSWNGTLTASGGAGGIANGSANSFAGPGGSGGNGTTRTLILV